MQKSEIEELITEFEKLKLHNSKKMEDFERVSQMINAAFYAEKEFPNFTK